MVEIDWTLVGALCAVAFLVSRVFLYLRNLKEVNYLSGLRCPFDPLGVPGVFIPTNSWHPAQLVGWYNRFSLYIPYKREMISIVPFIFGKPMYYTCSAEVMKQVFGHKSGFDKLQISVDALGLFGENVFSSFIDRWARHRKIVMPSFTQKLYAHVWNEVMRTWKDMIECEGWDKQDTNYVSDVHNISYKVALYIVSSCVFGMPLDWNESLGEKVNGMTVQDCFAISSASIVAYLICPRWVLRLPFTPLHKVGRALDNLEFILRGVIKARRQDGAPLDDDARDCFSLLLKANEAEEGEGNAALTDDELFSNVFLLMLAGHETTGRSMGATIALLACNPDEQEKAYQEIRSVIPANREPTFEDYESLPFVLNCIFEGLRLFPSAHLMTRRPLADTVVTVPTPEGDIQVPIKKDTTVTVDIVGICYNPRHYTSPDEFIPARWASPDVEPTMNFSYGPRICIGRKFAFVEGVCVLTMILKDWKIEPILKEGESMRAWRKRVLEDTANATVGFGPGVTPLRFTRRQVKA